MGTCANRRQEAVFVHGKGFHGKARENRTDPGAGLVNPGAAAVTAAAAYAYRR